MDINDNIKQYPDYWEGIIADINNNVNKEMAKLAIHLLECGQSYSEIAEFTKLDVATIAKIDKKQKEKKKHSELTTYQAEKNISGLAADLLLSKQLDLIDTLTEHLDAGHTPKEVAELTGVSIDIIEAVNDCYREIRDLLP